MKPTLIRDNVNIDLGIVICNVYLQAITDTQL